MTIRRLLLILLGGLLLILILVWFIHFMTTGKLVITTNSKYNTITISDSSADTAKSAGYKQIIQRRGTTLSLSLKSGKYVATVEGDSVSTSQVVNVRGHETTSYTINTIPASGVERVATVAAQNVAADDNRLFFLNTDDQSLNMMDSQNNLNTIPNTNYQTIDWADASYGVAQDQYGQLYVIDNSKGSSVITPLTTQGNLPAYAVSPSHQIFWSEGRDVYEGTNSNNWKKIYTAPDDSFTMSAGSSHLALLYNVDLDSGKAESKTIILNNAGKAIKVSSFGSFVLAWSQHDKYLAVENENGGEILDPLLKQVVSIPQKDFSHPVWLNDTVLFYSINDQVWSYNLDAEKSTLIANTPLAGTITDMTLNSDRSYLYLTVGNTDGSTSIERVGLVGQQVPQYVYQLQASLPELVDNYTLKLQNFNNSPSTVIVVPNPLTDPPTDLSNAKTFLQSLGIDTSKIQIQLSSD